MQRLGGEHDLLRRVEEHDVGVAARPEVALLREAEQLGGACAARVHPAAAIDRLRPDANVVHEREPRFDSRHACRLRHPSRGVRGQWSEETMSIVPAASAARSASRCAASRIGGRTASECACASSACRSDWSRTSPCDVTSPATACPRAFACATSRRRLRTGEVEHEDAVRPAMPASAIARCTASASPSGGHAAASQRGPVLPSASSRRVSSPITSSFSAWSDGEASLLRDREHRAEDRVVRDPVALVGHVELEGRDAAREHAGDLVDPRGIRVAQVQVQRRSRSPLRRRRPASRRSSSSSNGCPTAGWAKSTTVVTPPNAAARVPVANVSAVSVA